MNGVELALKEAEERFKETTDGINKGGSEIQKFYEGSVVFVTGGNGFMGKLLVEKLLRACNVKKIYILVRGKKGKPLQERLKDMREDPVFNNLRETKPDYWDKIEPVEGDIAAIRLGMSDENWKKLTEEVDTMFHLAATTRFDTPLPMATLINIRGTREMVTLARQCLKLKLFVHVSTAYCHATTDKIGIRLKEEFHSCPVPPDTMISLAESVDAQRVENITAELIKGWPNTYTFTKAVAEELVRYLGEELPVCVIRPPIVINTRYEPINGWVDMSAAYGPSGIIIGTSLGITRVCLTKRDVMLSYVPGDYINNTIMAAGWDCVKRRENGDRNVTIYTTSSTKCDTRYATISDVMNKPVIRNISTPKAMWYCYLLEVKSRGLYWVLTWFLHYIPAYIVDTICYVFKIPKPKGLESFVKLYRKVDKMADAYQYFLGNDWCFDDKNVVDLHQKMSPQDRTIFNIDVTTINWEHMVFIWCAGIKRFILKDDDKYQDYANKKQFVFKIANYVCAFLYLYVFYKICCLLFNFIMWCF